MVMPRWCVINEYENARHLRPRLRIRLVEILFFSGTRPSGPENRMLSNRNRHVTQVSRISGNGHLCRACQFEWKIAHTQKPQKQIRIRAICYSLPF